MGRHEGPRARGISQSGPHSLLLRFHSWGLLRTAGQDPSLGGQWPNPPVLHPAWLVPEISARIL